MQINTQENITNSSQKVVDSHICVNCFRSLGVPTKHSIFSYLSSTGKHTVSDLVEYVGLTQPTVSFHLNQMVEDGLLYREKSGKHVYYSVDKNCPIHKKTCFLKERLGSE